MTPLKKKMQKHMLVMSIQNIGYHSRKLWFGLKSVLGTNDQWLTANVCDDSIVFPQGNDLCRGYRKLNRPLLMPMIENIHLVVIALSTV